MRRIWREYCFEIIWLLVVALGIFLLVERMNIRQSLWGWLRLLIGVLESSGQRLAATIVGAIRSTTLSDFIGYVLISLAMVAMAWRIRWRIMHSPRWTTEVCPRCGGHISRVRRHLTDRLINLIIPVRRYRCREKGCGWSGLRVTTHRGRHRRPLPDTAEPTAR